MLARSVSGWSRSGALTHFFALFLSLANSHCQDDHSPDRCANGTCICDAREDCQFACEAPPCHVACGADSTCSGACANGECTCGERASCGFVCDAPPCHVTCDGSNPACSGECANGTCDCRPGSSCEFTCLSGPCHTLCGAGSSCVVHCPNAPAGSQDCDIARCESGSITLCPDGKSTTCNASCPVGDAG
ncbi:MAG: hypothetical protein QM778_30285 [Myxococcales bacterium]